jgi:acetylornithine deacetylase/succinyl-diaminopimelate desuccinylase-like protein
MPQSPRPPRPRNASYGAAAVISEIERMHAELAADAHPLVGPATWSVGQIHGGTGVSTVPGEWVVTADRRLLPGERAADVLVEIAARIDAIGLTDRGLRAAVRMTMDLPGFETPAEHPLVLVSSQAVRDAGGPDLPLGGCALRLLGG